jgi:ABC-type branched-subunit amino acid transport system ATPase component
VELADRVRAAQRQVDRETGEARAVALAGKRAEAQVTSLRSAVELHDQVTAMLTRIGEESQQVAQRQVEELVTRGLQTIFGAEYSFRLVQSVKGNQAQVDFMLVSDYGGTVGDSYGPFETPVMGARGGGMADAVGFMLRLVVLLLTPSLRRILALDEPFAHVSAEYEPRLAEFLREVCDKADVQIVLVTHSDAFSDLADTRYRFQLDATGMTEVSQL